MYANFVTNKSSDDPAQNEQEDTMPENNSDTDLSTRIAEKRAHMLDPEPHEAAPIPTNFHERVAEVEAGIAGIETVSPEFSALDLVAQLGDALAVPPHDEQGGVTVVASPEAKAIVNAALAAAADLKRRADALTKQRDAITDVLKKALGDNEELSIDGAVVATYKTSSARVLNQAHLKKVFPDTPENAEAWTDQERRTFLLK